MKKVLIALSLLLAGSASYAQVTLIPKGGLTLSQMSGKPFDGSTSSNVTGFLAGVAFNLPLDKDGFFSIQPELLYIQKGVRSNFDFAGFGTGTGNFKLNYIELPVLAKISFGGETFKGFVNLGPSIGYGLGGRSISTTTIFGGGNTNSPIDFGKRPDNYQGNETFINSNRLDFGVQFGGGISVAAGPGAILLEARYGFGLTKLANDSKPNNPSPLDGSNRVLAISLGYAIPLGGK